VIDSDINDEYWGSDHCPLSLVLKVGGASNLLTDGEKEIVKIVEKKEMIQAKAPVIPKKPALVD
jgi:hypothetical protein